MSPEHRQIRESLGAWAVGHLDPDEKAAVDAHLRSCSECREEAESLRQAGALISLVDPAIADSLSEPLPRPSPELGRRVMAEMRDPEPAAEKMADGRRRWWLALPVAGALAAAAASLVLVLGGGDGEGTGNSGQQFAFGSLPAGVTITGNLEPKATGTGIEVRVDGMKPGTLCRVYVKTSAGTLEPAGTFRYRYDTDEHESYPATLSTAWDLSEIDSLVIRAGPETFETGL